MNGRFTLSPKEIRSIKSLTSAIAAQYKSAEDDDFLFNAPVYAHELPRPMREFLNDFRMREWSDGYCLISGYPIDQTKIGPTPSHWKERRKPPLTIEEEILLILYGSLLGDVFSWSTQQAGFVVHNIMPIKSDENEQLGTGSKQLLWWHNEDAFHSFRGDYLGMMCLRNPDRVATTISCIDNVELDEKQKTLLFEPHFVIHPDESHLEKNRGIVESNSGEDEDAINASYKKILEMRNIPQKTSVLFGNFDSPYIQLDPYFMPKIDHLEAQEALDKLVRSLEGEIKEVVLQPGDYFFIDNFKAVHGRKPFQARYDGADRWLLRINVTRDMRKSRSARNPCTSRVIQ